MRHPGVHKHASVTRCDQGQILGCHIDKDSKIRACLYEDGRLTVFDAATDRPLGLNNRGQVVGRMGIDVPGSQGFLYQNGTLTTLGHLAGGYCLRANAINNHDQIVGDGDSTAFLRHAMLYDIEAGEVTDLGTLQGEKHSHSNAVAINDRGQIVGSSTAVGGCDHAFLYSDGRMIDLGTLNVTARYMIGDIYLSDFSDAQGINNQGQVVGCVNGGDMPHAFLYENKVMRDLNSMVPGNSGWMLISAAAINDNGQIVGRGLHHGKPHAFLLTPIKPNL